jgi:amino acid adenylation domain-containing protein
MSFNLDFIKNSKFDSNLAFCIRDENFTYLQFKERIFSIAQILKNQNISGQNIGVYTFNHLDTYASIYAIWITRNIYVPIHHTYPQNRVEEIVSQASIQTLIGSNTNPFPEVNVDFIDTSSLKMEVAFDLDTLHSHKQDEFMYILFTSGSTGKPKGVQISHQNLCSFLNHCNSMNMGLNPGDRYLQMFELTFDLSVVSFVLPLQNGGTIYTVSDENLKYLEIYRLLEDYEINFAIIVPSVLALLKPYFCDIDLPHLKHVALSGEAVPHKLTEDFQVCCPNAQFYNFYGPTECTIFCTEYTIPKEDIPALNGIVSIGTVTKDLTFKLVNDEGNESGYNEKSELYIGGPQVSMGYINNAELNQSLFCEIDGIRYYKTGDLVIQKEDGLFYYLGRKDQQVKIQGHRIELMEVEHLCTKALKQEVAVVAIKDERNFDNLVMFLRRNHNIQIIPELNKVLPKYMIPTQIIEVEDFPLNDNGKLDRKALKLSLQNGASSN